MSKYIDADALKEAIVKMMPHDKCGENTLEELVATEAFADAIMTIEDMPAADVEPVRKWIPCSEMLPEISCYVLAYYENISEIPEVLHYSSFPGHEGFYYDETIMSGVTHWMPLPEPPKMDGGSE